MDCTPENDNELLKRLKAGDRNAFADIYRKYHAELYTFAMHYMKNRQDAEDIMQQVFVKFWTIREALLISSNPKSYLYAMVKHHVMNYIRDKNNALQHNYRIVQQTATCDDDLYMYAERHHLTELLETAIDRLPGQQQIVARMRCEGYSNQEIAARLNLSVHTVNTHYRECVKRLKACLPRLAKMFIIYLFCNL